LLTARARKHQSPSKRTAHKESIINTPKVEETTEVDEKYKVEKLREDKLTQSSLNEQKVKEISVETSIKKVETLGSDQPLRRSKEIKTQRAHDFKNYTQLNIKKSYIPLILITILIVSTVSVTGLLQSTESVNSSGVLTQIIPQTPPLKTPSPPPPEPEVEIDVYNDRECTEKLTDIKWGEIGTGKLVKRVIYIKNTGDSEVTLSLVTDNWDPNEVLKHMTLLWDYDGENLSSGAIMKITLTLKVDASISILGNFNFDIIIIGSA
jgi:hypothetical protein